jgi:hypothetical protein
MVAAIMCVAVPDWTLGNRMNQIGMTPSAIPRFTSIIVGDVLNHVSAIGRVVMISAQCEVMRACAFSLI